MDNSRIGIGDKRRAAHARDQQVAQYFLPAAMRTALDRGEFFAVYQPIFRLADTTIIGAEALLRWAHPKLGTLLPGRFIEIAENNGLITSLTAFVIEEACRVARDWRDDSSEPQPFVSVNIASSVICDPGFIPLVKNALTGNGLPAIALQLELGHDTSLGKDAAALIALQELSALGVGIAIDDFGTGFSSFANLPNLPVGVVKLAGKLVENIGGSIRDRAADEQITRAMIELGRGLGLTVTAKHVETPRQLDRLHAFGCNNAQGWHFAQPLPASSFLAG
ncbi:EAL domain-containing protein [Mycobacterium persicum]|nr:EAL domain-containing protein [Mycobacterium persicum]ORB82432.1 EAL domain-containing protein [Mycobacterium persicum]